MKTKTKTVIVIWEVNMKSDKERRREARLK